jgi:hypothetical protein
MAQAEHAPTQRSPFAAETPLAPVQWTALLNLAAAAGLIATATWALMSTQVAGGLFYFPHNAADAVLHLGTSAIFLAGAAHYYLSRT